MRVQFIEHEAFEAPGAYQSWAHGRGHEVRHTKLYAGDPLPLSSDDIDLLVVMGGPQSPSSTKEQSPHFDAAAEQALIADCVSAGKAVVGICLGSQLVGEALGASYATSPEKEIGKFPITLTEEGSNNPKFSHFGHQLEVGHWHNDMPGLTPTATIIATSEGCPRQIVEYSDLVYGFQCHMEFTPEVVELLIEAETDLPTLTNHRFVQQPDALRANSWAEMNDKLHTFLDHLADAYSKTGRPDATS